MGFIRQSKIAGYQLGQSMGYGTTLKGKQRYASWVAGEASDMAKKSARKAKIYRAIGTASKFLKGN